MPAWDTGSFVCVGQVEICRHLVKYGDVPGAERCFLQDVSKVYVVAACLGRLSPVFPVIKCQIIEVTCGQTFVAAVIPPLIHLPT